MIFRESEVVKTLYINMTQCFICWTLFYVLKFIYFVRNFSFRVTFCSSWIRVLWCQKFLCDTLRRILIKRNPWEDSLARLDEVMGHFFMHFVPWKKTESLLKLYIWSKAKLICLLVPHSQTYTVNSLCK